MEEQFKELLIAHRVFRDDEKTRRCIEAMKEVWNMAKPEWVSVNDKMPHIGQYVLVFCEDECFQPTNFAISQYGKYGFIGNETVTHWMELIKPNVSP